MHSLIMNFFPYQKVNLTKVWDSREKNVNLNKGATLVWEKIMDIPCERDCFELLEFLLVGYALRFHSYPSLFLKVKTSKDFDSI